MRISAIAVAATLLLCGCADQPTPKDSKAVVKDAEQDSVKERQLSIEEAAEEATKLIEAEAKAEVDAAAP